MGSASKAYSIWSYIYWSVSQAGKPNTGTNAHTTKDDDLVIKSKDRD